MNFQQKIPEEVVTLLKKKIGSKELLKFSDYDYFAFPQMFASTAGPQGGIGGQAMTTFTVHVYEMDNGFTLYLCAGCYILREEKFDFFKQSSLSGWKKM